MRIVKVFSLFLGIWLLVPELINLVFKEVKFYSYDSIIINEIIIFSGSLLFIVIAGRKNYGFNFCVDHSVAIVFWTLILQSFTIIGVILLISFSLPLPRFVYAESLAFVFFKYVILVTICEEIFMRGLLQGELSSLSGTINVNSIQLSAPVIITAVLFGIMHLFPLALNSLKDFISTFILGLIAGYYREKTQSLIPAFIAHASYNFWGGFLHEIVVHNSVSNEILYLVEGKTVL